MNSELETLVSSVGTENRQDEAAREIESVLNSGINAAKNGNREEAKALLFRVTDIDPRNEMAWLWLASVSEYPEELLTFLHKVLSINPANEQALEWERSTKGLLARNLVQYGITAVQEDKKESARRCFMRALETDENNEMAWLWMASITDVPAEKVVNLEKVLAINPQNEVANTLLKLIHKEEAQELLQRSKTAAVNGNKQEALEILEQVKQLDAELDEVWILQAHLADSFEEKALCYNQALACNPENEIARVGLASLESIMQAVNPAGSVAAIGFDSPEVKEEFEAAQHSTEMAEMAEMAAETDEDEPAAEFAAEGNFVETVEAQDMAHGRPVENGYFESITEDEAATAVSETLEEELYFQPAAAKLENEFAAAGDDAFAGRYLEDDEDKQPTGDLFAPAETDMNEAFSSAENPVFDETEENDSYDEELKFEPFDSSQVEEMSFGGVEPEQMTAPEKTAEQTPEETPEETVETLMNEEASSVPDAFVDSSIKAETFYLGQGENQSQAAREVAESDSETTGPEIAEARTEMSAQLSLCPFCSAENNINHEICAGCHAVLGMYNLDMLLSNQDVDQEKVSEAIEFMEAHLEDDSCTAEEHFNLGLAHLNLKNMDEGMKYLQKSYILNPTNSFLKAQIDELAKRMGSDQIVDEDGGETRSAQKTIMVVDDSATIRKLVSAKLEKHGHSVIAAVDGMEALAKLEEVVPDLILLDITMPRLDGYQVCKLIRANENTRFVPIILISGKDGFFDKVRGKMCGSTSYITKPFGPEMLLKAVEAYSK